MYILYEDINIAAGKYSGRRQKFGRADTELHTCFVPVFMLEIIKKEMEGICRTYDEKPEMVKWTIRTGTFQSIGWKTAAEKERNRWLWQTGSAELLQKPKAKSIDAGVVRETPSPATSEATNLADVLHMPESEKVTQKTVLQFRLDSRYFDIFFHIPIRTRGHQQWWWIRYDNQGN